MVVVVAGGFKVQRGEQRKCEGLEEMFGEFGAEIAHFIPFEAGSEFNPRTAG
jgi:hypothetical protein